jgi:hypothetical protein
MKAITKKLKDEIFVWDPTAYQGKGYWYVLGTKGGYGRAASKVEFRKLGKPSQDETEPESPDVFDEDDTEGSAKSRGYKQAARTRKKGIASLAFEKWYDEGKGIKQSIKESISDKFKAEVTGFKEAFDPLNIATKIFGNMGGAIIGSKMGRDEKDVEYFTGYGHKKKKGDTASPEKLVGRGKKVGQLDTAKYTSIGEGQQKRMNKGDGAADVLARLYNMIKKNTDEEKKNHELEKNFKKSKESKREEWNNKLIEAITGKKENEPKAKTVKKEDENIESIWDKLIEFGEMLAGLRTLVGTMMKTPAMARALVPFAASVIPAAVVGGIMWAVTDWARDASVYDKDGKLTTTGSILDTVLKMVGNENGMKPDSQKTQREKINEKYKMYSFFGSGSKDQLLKDVRERNNLGTPISKYEAEKIKETLGDKLTEDDIKDLNARTSGLLDETMKSEDNRTAEPPKEDKKNTDKSYEKVEKANPTIPAGTEDNKETNKASPVAPEKSEPSKDEKKPEKFSLNQEKTVDVAKLNTEDVGTNSPDGLSNNRVIAAINENEDLSLNGSGGRSTVIADNSSKVNIINGGNKLFSESLASVRLGDDTWNKILKSNYRQV